MFDIDHWREIFQSINKNKLRTILSGFTIAFAIMLFTILFGIGNGLRNTFQSQFAGDSMYSIYLWASKTTKPYKGLQSGRPIQLRNDDIDFIINNYDSKLSGITPKIDKRLQAVYKGEQDTYQVTAVYPDVQKMEQAEIESGRFISLLDLQQRNKVVSIGRLVEQDLFGQLSALGKNITIDGISYKVIGTFSDPGGSNDERIIYAPFTTIQRLYGNTDELGSVTLSYNPNLNVNQAISFSNNLTKALKEKHGVAPSDQGAIRLFNMAEVNRDTSNFMLVLNLIILFIGIGTLIAGIIGISNIMVYIVRERTKELGIRKALGATPRSIISMIMMESILITAIAGYVGLLIGTGVLKSLGTSLEQYFITNPSVNTGVVIGATIILIIAGTIAGYLPAKRAARIKPIDALNDN